MRIFAVSDIHIDYEANARWVAALSAADYRDDVLILAGDVTDSLRQLDWCLTSLAARFRAVLFVPGNHDLWVVRDGTEKDSMRKLEDLQSVVASCGASTQPFRAHGVRIVPLLGWYDYSFGQPSEELKSIWMDFRACRWPVGFDVERISAHFSSINDRLPSVDGGGDKVITFSHFLPRIDVMPHFIPWDKRILYPVLGTTRIESHLRRMGASIHIYGHSHVNRSVTIDGVRYVNNAFGYPQETRIASKRLLSIYEC